MMMKRIVSSLAIVGLLIAWLPAAAQAQPSAHHRGLLRSRHGNSTNWSGYAALTNLSHPSSNAVTDVKGQWVVPAVTCGSATTYSSNWVGIDGYASSTVEQTGTEHDCYRGKAYYSAWYEMYPRYPSTIRMTINPGDTISTEVRYAGNNRYTLTLKNVTANRTFSTTQTLRAARSSAEWVVEAPSSFSGVLPLSNFGTTSITSATATINGHTGGINDAAWQNDKINMVTSTGTVKAATSDLSPDGQTFSVVWSHL